MSQPILLVEDDRDDEALVRRVLSSFRAAEHVVVAHDGAEALDYLFALGRFSDREAAQVPKLILLDLSLPKIDGMEVLRQIRADPLTKPVPVVILTSSRQQEDLLSGYGAGANSYVVKPSDLEKFLEAARDLGRYWLELNTVPTAVAS